tara:strand:+ start:378 stop:1742 length:1365 start_codon:yes stop_codon:yes gene_type:complete
MASEIRVNKIINRSGLSTVTFTDDGAIVSGIVTANSFSGNVTGNVTGSGANLTSIPAGQLTGTVADARLSTVSSSKLSGALPALDGSALTGVGHSFGNSSVNTSGIITATAFVPSAQGSLSHRNLVINGAMRVAQRATSSTANGYGDLDRWQHEYASTDENPTFAQVSLTTSDAPYTLGLTKAAKITNGNQTSGLQSSSQINFNQNMEAQDIRNSGWNYKSSSSYITLSFWVRASVSQNYHGFVKTADGSNYSYSYETGTLSANTWTKITKAIPGNSNLQIDDDNGSGFQIFPIAIYGTGFTDNSISNDVWKSWSSGLRTKDQTSTWYTTNNATLEITGVQLEVGPVATPFEHRSIGDEMLRCKRYFQPYIQYAEYVSGGTGNLGFPYTAFTVPMRASPTFTSDHESKSSNWSFATMQVQGSDAYGYYAYAISYNTTNSNYGYMRRYGGASAEL